MPGTVALLRKRAGHHKLAAFRVISRNVPVMDSNNNGFGGTNASSNAVDGDYGTHWHSVVSPNGGTAVWLALDLRGVTGKPSSAWCVWKNPTMPYYQPSATLGGSAGSTFSSVPRNYTLQGHPSSGALPADGDVGWVTLATVTDNNYSQRIHTALNLTNVNWFRFRATAANGVTGSTDDVVLQLDLRDATGPTEDSIYGGGDSITMNALRGVRPDNPVWTNGPLENVLMAATGRADPPVLIGAGVGGWHIQDLDADKVARIGGTPCKYVMLNFGSNDANAANIDLNDPGVIPPGINSTYAQAFKTSYQSVIDYCASLGKICIIPHAPWGDLSTWSQPNLIILNAIIDQLVAANPGKVIAGPDFYSFYFANQNLLADHLHPTYDPGVPAGMLSGLTGYEWWHRMYRDRLKATLY